METKVVTSKQFTWNLRDFTRGFILAVIAAVIPIFEDVINSWVQGEPLVINWIIVKNTAIVAAVSYLILNFSSKSKVIAITGTGVDLKDTEKQITKVI